MPYTLTDDEIEELWDRYGAGETPASLTRRSNKPSTSINSRIRDPGGIRPPKRDSRPRDVKGESADDPQ